MTQADVLSVVTGEVEEVVDLVETVWRDLDTAAEPERLQDLRHLLDERIARIGETADILDLSGLVTICAAIRDNLGRLEPSDALREALPALVHSPALIRDYLRNPEDPVARTALVDHLCGPHWPRPVTDAERERLVRELAAASPDAAQDTGGDGRAGRPQSARPEDVALAVSENVNPVLVDAFVTEGPSMAGAYSSLIEQIVRVGHHPETMNEARRLVHTIKGAANTIGVRGIASLTHHLEDVLEYLVEHDLPPGDDIGGLLLESADMLEMMIESVMTETPAPDRARETLQRVLDTVHAIERGEEPVTDAEPREGVAGTDTGEVGEPVSSIDHGSAGKGEDARPEGDETPVRRAEARSRLRVSAAMIDEVLRLSGEMTTGRAHIQERLHQAFGISAELRERYATLQERVNEVERAVTIQGVTAGQKTGARTTRAGDTVFDALELDQYSEVHGTVHSLVETVADLQALEGRMADTLSVIETAVTQQGMVNSELHEQVMSARMVPAGTIEPRLARAVRQACDASGKAAQLSFSGADVMLDEGIINELVNPLMHILRNAVDHGIEDPQARKAAGKAEAGQITCSFAREGNHVVVRCADDGAGLDLARIRQASIEHGLILHDATLDDDEIARLILAPGFSTRAEVSEVSGRGVGMDVVHATVRELKGNIDIATTPGRGCRFTLRLPMTLGIAHCLVVRAGRDVVAIPTDFLDRAVHQGAVNIERLGAQYTYREGRESLAAHDLAHMLGLVGDRSMGDPEDTRPVIIFNDIDGRKAIAVDALLFGHDLVIKNLGRYLSGARGAIGASMLGDGRVIPVLDLHELLRSEDRYAGVPQSPAVHRPMNTEHAAASKDVLVVDDSFTVRQTLSLLLEGEGYTVRTARDGVEGLEQASRQLPAALLVDLEMPRMNGLELTSRLRAAESARDMAVIMITSRSSEKHRQQARLAGVDLYVTKPYSDEYLIGQLRSMLNETA